MAGTLGLSGAVAVWRHPPVYPAKSFAMGIDEGTPILFNSLSVFRLTAGAVALTIWAIAVGP